MALAPLIPEGFALGDLLVALGALLGWAVCLGLLWAWRGTFSIIFQSIASALTFRIHTKFFSHTFHLGSWAANIDTTAQHALSSWASQFENAAGRFFHAAAQLTEWTARELAGLANDSLTFAHYLTHHWIPDYIAGLKDLAHSTTKIVTHVVTKVERIEVRTVRVVKTTAKAVAAETVPSVAIPHVGEWEWLHRHWPSVRKLVASAGAITLPGTIPDLWGEIRELIRSRGQIQKRLRKVEALIGATAMAAAMANVLGVSARCVRSGNVGRAARALCGLDSVILNALLAGLIALETPISIEELAHEFLTIEDDVLGLIKSGVSELAEL